MQNFTRGLTLMLGIAIMAFVLGCASTDKKESTGEYIDDTVITTKVKAELIKDDDLNAGEINVETYKGVVQLSGFVKSQGDINKAGRVAQSVNGVKSVKNDIRLK
jgi:osmotically-inducible protein OsmY